MDLRARKVSGPFENRVPARSFDAAIWIDHWRPGSYQIQDGGQERKCALARPKYAYTLG